MNIDTTTGNVKKAYKGGGPMDFSTVDRGLLSSLAAVFDIKKFNLRVFRVLKSHGFL